MRLNIGAGGDTEEGWEPWDISQGNDCRDMALLAAGTVSEIRASHVLEHIPRADTLGALREWRRVLRLGGRLFVAVPDFELVARAFLAGAPDPNIESYIMGGQTDENDFHFALFTEGKLRDLLRMAGFSRVMRTASEGTRWNCSRHWCSLNMEAFADGEDTRGNTEARAR